MSNKPSISQIGNYKITRIIGSGAMGEVFEGVHPQIGKKVAIKILVPHLTHVEHITKRFIQEAKTINKIEHPNIIEIYDLGQLDDGRYYYTMELLNGMTLSALMKKKPLNIKNILKILDEICDALSSVHKTGIVHRDMKPSNVFIAKKGRKLTVKILDFGIAKLMEPEDSMLATSSGTVLGTPAYMSPEQAMGTSDKISNKSDIYSVGVILYKMLSGYLPFKAKNLGEIITAHLTNRQIPLKEVVPDIPDAIIKVVEKAIKENPEERYDEIYDLFEDFEAAVENINPSTVFDRKKRKPVKKYNSGDFSVKFSSTEDSQSLSGFDSMSKSQAEQSNDSVPLPAHVSQAQQPQQPQKEQQPQAPAPPAPQPEKLTPKQTLPFSSSSDISQNISQNSEIPPPPEPVQNSEAISQSGIQSPPAPKQTLPFSSASDISQSISQQPDTSPVPPLTSQSQPDSALPPPPAPPYEQDSFSMPQDSFSSGGYSATGADLLQSQEINPSLIKQFSYKKHYIIGAVVAVVLLIITSFFMFSGSDNTETTEVSDNEQLNDSNNKKSELATKNQKIKNQKSETETKTESKTESKPKVAAAKQTPPPPPKPVLYQIKILADQPNIKAIININDKTIKAKLPHFLKVEKNAKITVTASKNGFKNKTINIIANKDKQINIRLSPVKKAVVSHKSYVMRRRRKKPVHKKKVVVGDDLL